MCNLDFFFVSRRDSSPERAASVKKGAGRAFFREPWRRPVPHAQRGVAKPGRCAAAASLRAGQTKTTQLQGLSPWLRGFYFSLRRVLSRKISGYTKIMQVKTPKLNSNARHHFDTRHFFFINLSVHTNDEICSRSKYIAFLYEMLAYDHPRMYYASEGHVCARL